MIPLIALAIAAMPTMQVCLPVNKIVAVGTACPATTTVIRTICPGGSLVANTAPCPVVMPTAAAPTSSADMEAIAKLLEKNTSPSPTLDKQLWALLLEPEKTLDGVVLAPEAYTGTIDTAAHLKSPNWYAGATEHYPPASGNVNCTAAMSFWDPTPPAGLRIETYAWGLGACPSVLLGAIARSWGWKLKQVGR